MNDRDRLIELIADIQKDFEKWCVECAEDGHKDHQPLGEYLADKLLANGVIVQQQGEWISAPIKDKGYDSKTIPTCTNCGYLSFIKYTFCPECGAKLKERERNG